MDSLTFFLVVMFSLRASLVQVEGTRMGNETDRAALLEFRSQIHDDPDRIFSSWNVSIDFCRWPGVTCGRRHPRVTRLELPGSRLMGSLSPYIGNLSFLKVIDINNNSFSGEIPPEIGNLHRLIAVFLDNNSFSGQLPENISGCTNLQVITVQNSMLGGEIPRGLAALSELRTFQIYHNNFTGKFPDFFGNFSYLKTMAADYNQFVGTIPASLGQMKKLQYFLLGGNFFSGTVPLSIFNITSLVVMELGLNQLEGHLPLDLGITLPNLNYLSVSGNHLTGLVPPSISNATNLQVLQISINNFSGPVPDLNNLNLLQWVDISFNQLGSGKLGDLRFVELINSTELQHLDFRSNFLGGLLPQSIGNISSNLNLLEFDFNQLTGTIPSSIGNLRKLEKLTTSENPFTGRLPDEIGNLHNLKILIMMNSIFSGKIPSLLGNLTMLIILSLAGNKLQGSIPESLEKCQNLIELDLNGNNLSGAIPSQLLSISSLSSYLDLSWNKLTGALPDQIGSLTNLERLDVQENRLSGRVPNTLSQCISLEKLYMGNNLFEGNITSFLRPLKGLQYLDLSQNNFSSQIPEFLGTFQLRYLNLSFNRFEGIVPNQGVFLNSSAVAVKGNERLCGGILELHLPSCTNPKSMPRRKISSKVITATACGIGLMFILLSFLALSICMRKHRRRKQLPNSHLVLGGFFPQISYEDILKATEGLDKNNLIGTGCFGSVYKGILRDGNNMVAIKVLNLQTGAASKSFLAECEALRNIRHRNLVKILTACSTIDFQGNDFKALVYEYMENGSLDVWLHHTAEGVHQNLSLIQRLSIANDIACAVEYLHHESEMPIIHCDIKPGNILLDMEMTSHVGDFGLARILPTAEVVLQVSSVGVRGTIGYSPPEYGMGSPVSMEGDVYSYGILLLEMFTGKRPTDNMFENGCNIRCFCEAALPDRVGEITDPSLFSNLLGEGSSIPASTRAKECLVKVFEVGISCCQDLPRERMDIRDASAKLRSIKAALP